MISGYIIQVSNVTNCRCSFLVWVESQVFNESVRIKTTSFENHWQVRIVTANTIRTCQSTIGKFDLVLFDSVVCRTAKFIDISMSLDVDQIWLTGYWTQANTRLHKVAFRTISILVIVLVKLSDEIAQLLAALLLVQLIEELEYKVLGDWLQWSLIHRLKVTDTCSKTYCAETAQ